jgi:hypothetical protein
LKICKSYIVSNTPDITLFKFNHDPTDSQYYRPIVTVTGNPVGQKNSSVIWFYGDLTVSPYQYEDYKNSYNDTVAPNYWYPGEIFSCNGEKIVVTNNVISSNYYQVTDRDSICNLVSIEGNGMFLVT